MHMTPSIGCSEPAGAAALRTTGAPPHLGSAGSAIAAMQPRSPLWRADHSLAACAAQHERSISACCRGASHGALAAALHSGIHHLAHEKSVRPNSRASRAKCPHLLTNAARWCLGTAVEASKRAGVGGSKGSLQQAAAAAATTPAAAGGERRRPCAVPRACPQPWSRRLSPPPAQATARQMVRPAA